MDTEQYEEAVRDYEKVYQTEKTKGKDVREPGSQGTVVLLVGPGAGHKSV